jgi:hypothetical protein
VKNINFSPLIEQWRTADSYKLQQNNCEGLLFLYERDFKNRSDIVWKFDVLGT